MPAPPRKSPADPPRDRRYAREVRRPILPLRRPHRDEEHVGLLDEARKSLSAGEVQALPARTPGHELLETRLVDRHPSRPQAPHALLVPVHARHPVPEVRQASPRHESDVPGPDNPYPKTLGQSPSPNAPELPASNLRV